MARPTRLTIDNGSNGWDALANSNFQNLFDRPLPIVLHAGDETDLEATFPAASYDKCLIWVEHSVDGWTLYFSDGAVWAELGTGGGGSGLLEIESITTTDTIAATTNYAICSGTTYTVTLPSAVTVGAGWVLYLKFTASGEVTVDGDGSETIDGAATFVLRYANQTLELVSDGTNWSIAGQSGERPIALAQESLSGVGTIGNYTDVVLASGTTYTLTLPAAATYGLGRLLRVKRTSSGTITLDGNASETIDGAATFALSVALSSVSLYCDGSNWHIV